MRLIDADKLKEVISSNHYLLSAKHNSTDYGMFTTGIIEAIDNAQPVEQNWRFYYDHGYAQAKRDFERPHGKWIEGENGNIKCNKCGCEIRYSYLIGNKSDFPKFCCDCGADMRKEADNEADNM